MYFFFSTFLKEVRNLSSYIKILYVVKASKSSYEATIRNLLFLMHQCKQKFVVECQALSGAGPECLNVRRLQSGLKF